MKETLYNWAGKVIPASLWALLATIVAAYRTLIKTGFMRSARRKLSETRDGQPIPRFTYPAIAYLDTLDLQDSEVFEWGAGWSTLYWVRRGAMVAVVETEKEWRWRVLGELQRRELQDCRDVYPVSFVKTLDKWPYDIAVVDGDARFANSVRAKAANIPMIIVDDTQALPDVVRILSEKYHHIPFAGLGPISHTPKVTSVFLRKP